MSKESHDRESIVQRVAAALRTLRNCKVTMHVIDLLAEVVYLEVPALTLLEIASVISKHQPINAMMGDETVYAIAWELVWDAAARRGDGRVIIGIDPGTVDVTAYVVVDAARDRRRVVYSADAARDVLKDWGAL
jgi:hypothetical protein